MMRWICKVAAFLLVAAVAGCGAPPPPPPTVVVLQITATADANTGAGGAGAPIMLRVYQLAGTNAFDNADFFQIFNHDTATLGADLVHKDQFLLAPGSTKTVTLTPPDRATALGFFAAYGTLQSTTWRADSPIAAHKTTHLTVTVGRTALTVKPAGS
ncbi:MAG TPA: type VI secretion system lipoprotein TssJ [Acetobacteraceae bacterium]|nr:type VI secretion system lipoprotein TssJ [Acetobacteraceae bacterium]